MKTNMASFGIFSYTRGTPERDVPSRTVMWTSLKPTKNKLLKKMSRRPLSPFCPSQKV